MAQTFSQTTRRGLYTVDSASGTPNVNLNANFTALDNAAFAASVVVNHSDGTQTAYQAAAASNSANGTALVNAIAASVPYDEIHMAPGTFDTGTVTLHQKSLTALIGVGIDKSIILSAAILSTHGAILNPGTSNCYGRGFTIQGNAASGQFQIPLGMNSAQVATDTNFSGAFYESIRLLADSDGVYVSPAATSNTVNAITLVNCKIDTNFDCFTVAGAGYVNIIGCQIATTGPSGCANYSNRGISGNGSTTIYNVINTKITATADTGSLLADAIYAYAGTINLTNCTLSSASNGTASAMDIAYVAGVVNVDQSSSFNASKSDVTSAGFNWLSGPLFAPSSGTAYDITATATSPSFGTTSPVLTFPNAGRFMIRCAGETRFVAATTTSSQLISLSIVRVNNTQGTLTGSTSSQITGIVTTLTAELGHFSWPEFAYNAAAGDIITPFIKIASVPAAGTVTLNRANLVAIPLR